ncbi:transcriptional regulator (plasmid) [Kribbella sp. GL6]|uniref:transcriptional regulator n=1 Tax=Kribbella sp. GL6 TaxID=3419765 RepID=UPI003CFD07EC
MVVAASPAETFSAVGVALYAVHAVADHWVQTNGQATRKGRRAPEGVQACLAHVATYTLATAGIVALVWIVFALPINPAGFVAGQVISAGTHYWADRRYPLAWLARVVGKEDYYASPGGAYQLDQSWHLGWLLVVAFATALI